MIGTNDLAMSMGHPGDFGHPEVAEAYEAVCAACKKHGKYAGSGGVYDVGLSARNMSISASASFSPPARSA